MQELKKLEEQLVPLKEKVNNHPLYQRIKTIEDVRTFTESHVFAVWDFMSLLKALQIHLTCTQLPWTPVGNAKTARFINEIVLEEETDRNENGEAKSHFEMYVEAMQQLESDTSKISGFLNDLQSGSAVTDALEKVQIEPKVKEFVAFTFEVIQTNKPHIIAACFTFGREDIIPDMFIKIVENDSKQSQKDYSKFSYYLNRHIELDGGDHGPIALNMIQELCGNDKQKWNEATLYAKKSIEKRIELWDAVAAKIDARMLVI